MTMRTRLVALLVAAAATAGGCGGDEAGTSSTGTTTTEVEPAVSSTEAAPSTEPSSAGGEATTSTSIVADAWEQSSAVLLTAGIATQSDIPAEAPEIHAMGASSEGYVVAGTINGGFAVWRSVDLESFEPVYSEICCERHLRAASIAEFDGTLLIGGTGEFGTDLTEQAFILRSDDAGASWALIEDPLFASEANRVDRIVVTGDVVLVETVDDRGPGQPRSVAAWSDDLTTWQPVELPGRQPDDWPWFALAAETVFAISQRYDGPEGLFSNWVIWRSDDGGRGFVEASTLADAGIDGFLAVGDTLVAVPAAFQGESRHVDARGLLVLDGEGGWRQLEPDTGTWGDGWVTAHPTAASEQSGRTYALVTRTMRASAHYCYDDAATCQQPETALLTTEDGTTWHDVAGFPATDDVRGEPMLLTTDAAGGIALLAASYEDPQIRITRWTAGSPPPFVDNPDYAAPDIPVPLYDHEQPFDIGDERRYPLGLGGCGGMYVDGQLWEPDSPLPSPPPPDWPVRSVQIVDGPEGYVYGRIHRIASDTIEFSIEGLGPVATFRPAPPPEYVCG